MDQELKDFHHKPYANGAVCFRGSKASIETNGTYTLPWSIVLEDRRRLSDHGSYATAYRAFKRFGLESI